MLRSDKILQIEANGDVAWVGALQLVDVEIEFRAAAHGICEVLWLKKLLEQEILVRSK